MPRLHRFALVLLLGASVAASGCAEMAPALVSPFYRAVVPLPDLVYGREDAARWVAHGRDFSSFLALPEDAPDGDVLGRLTYIPHEGTAAEVWRPMRRQVAHLRRLLYQRIEDDRLQPQCGYPGTLNQYTVRYIGIVNKAQRYVFVMGEREWYSNDPQDWPGMENGGTSVFEAKYDPATRKMIWFDYRSDHWPLSC